MASFNPFDLAAPSLTVAKGINDLGDFNRDEPRVVEMPAVNGTGTARSIAKLYGTAATGSLELGLSAGTLDALKSPAQPPSKGLCDKVLHVDTNFTLGFNKPSSLPIFGSSGNAFGTQGAGGSSDSPIRTPESATATAT